MTAPKHFLDLDQFDGETLRKQLALGMAFKTGASEIPRPLEGNPHICTAEPDRHGGACDGTRDQRPDG